MTLDDEWFCSRMDVWLSEDDARKFKQEFRKVCQKNLMNFEINDKNSIVMFFADYVNALIYIANKMNWRDGKYNFEGKEALLNSEGNGRLKEVFHFFTTDTEHE